MTKTVRTVEPLTPLFDSHAHIHAKEFAEDIDEVIARMRAAGLVGCVTVGCDWCEDDVVLDLTNRYPGFVYGAWALHPEYDGRTEPNVEEIIDFCSPKSMVAVGETGLDYYWHPNGRIWQRPRFVRHIEAALKLNKPLIVHARQAESDALDILVAHDAGRVGFVLHCYGGDLATAKRAIDLGGLVSFTGVLTFPKSDELRAIARALPLESLMIETDCPYMAPVPFRGRRNEPTYVGSVARTLAQLFDCTPEHVAETTTRTAARFFRIPLPETFQ